jgi:nucleotide-binding universal stress UspA family protein
MRSQPFRRILVAVDDSAAALAAVRLAVDLASPCHAVLLLAHVIGDGELDRALARLSHEGRGTPATSRDDAAAALLRHVHAEARAAGVAAETRSLTGRPAPRLLEAAREWGADLVVIGRSDAGGPGHGYVGAVTREVLEFSEVAVLVVPRSGLASETPDSA